MIIGEIVRPTKTITEAEVEWAALSCVQYF